MRKTKNKRIKEKKCHPTKTVLILKSNGEKEMLFRKTNPSLKTLQKWVGGLVEVVWVRQHPLDKDLDIEMSQMLVNEEGRLRGLPVNVAATDLYRSTYGNDLYIVGDAVLLVNFILR